MIQHIDVMVVGGGVVGLSAAIAMKQRGFSVAVLDVATFEYDLNQQDLRVYAINQASSQLLHTLGVWQKLDVTRLSPYRKMHVWDAVSDGKIDFDAKMVQTDRLGTIIEESSLKQALLQQALKENVLFFPNTKVTDVKTLAQSICVKSDSGEWMAQLLIVSDGAKSTTRARLNIPMTTWPYHQHAIITRATTTLEHQETAYQVFHPNGPLAFLPLVDKHQCSIVWSTSVKEVNQLMMLSDEMFQEKLACAFGKKLGEVVSISPRRQFPLTMQHTQCYSGSNWLLMGDAAHTIHPLAGLGLNIGLADLATWLSIFDKHAHFGSKKVMGAYQRQRKHAVWQQIFLMEGIKTVFANPLPPLTFLRGVGLHACNQMSLIKHIFIEHASG